VIGERIRDKFAASRRKGMWMGGTVPLGYRVENRKLLIQEGEAATIRMIFERFLQTGSATVLARTLHAEGITSRSGRPIDKGMLYKLINNRVYIGEAVHKGQNYPGEHQAIIEQALWDKVHAILKRSPRSRAANARSQTPALLKGLIFSPDGQAMSPTHTRRKGRLYRYYVTQSVLKLGPDTCPIRRVPAGEIEQAVVDQLRLILRQPAMVVKTWLAVREQSGDGVDCPALERGATISEAQVRESLCELDLLWNELFPVEQSRIVHLLVERVDIGTDGARISLRREGLTQIADELGQSSRRRAGAPDNYGRAA
jgi:hypothetical protein